MTVRPGTPITVPASDAVSKSRSSGDTERTGFTDEEVGTPLGPFDVTRLVISRRRAAAAVESEVVEVDARANWLKSSARLAFPLITLPPAARRRAVDEEEDEERVTEGAGSGGSSWGTTLEEEAAEVGIVVTDVRMTRRRGAMLSGRSRLVEPADK